MRCDGVAAPGHAPPAEIGRRDLAIVCLGTEMNSLITQIIVKKLNSLKHLVRTTVAESHN